MLNITQKNIKKIAVFRALYLGDLLCAVPAMRAIRAAFPLAEIVLIGLPWSASFVKRFHRYIDRLIIFPGCPGLPEQIPDDRRLLSFLEKMQWEQFDLVLQMQGNGTIVNYLIKAFGAKYYGGFYPDHPPRDFAEWFIPYPDDIPEVKRHLKLTSSMGIPSSDPFLEFPVDTQDLQDYRHLHLNLIDNQYIIIHPGSRDARRQWHPKYFASLADLCVSKGFFVFISGTKEETPIAEEVLKYMKNPAVNLTGLTTLGTMGLLIQNAFMLITNCTGVSHIAAALGTRSIVISMDGEPARWGPLNRKLHHVFDCHAKPNFTEVFHHLYNSLKQDSQILKY